MVLFVTANLLTFSITACKVIGMHPDGPGKTVIKCVMLFSLPFVQLGRSIVVTLLCCCCSWLSGLPFQITVPIFLRAS